MASMHWQTWQILYALQQYLYQQLHDLSQCCSESMLWVGEQGIPSISSLQVVETRTEIIVKAQIPDVVTESLDIQVTPETVVIKGVQLEPKEQWDYFNLEFYSSRFQSVIPLPSSTQPQTAVATLDQNTLTVTLQKAGQTQRPVKVKLLSGSESIPKAAPTESTAYLKELHRV